MLTTASMVVGLDVGSPELGLGRVVVSPGGDLPAVVFSHDAITKVHDARPMVFFRFQSLARLEQARENDWVACFFLWGLLNEGMSHKGLDRYDRVEWFHMASMYVVKFMVADNAGPIGR
jgi:hypothetical protein